MDWRATWELDKRYLIDEGRDRALENCIGLCNIELVSVSRAQTQGFMGLHIGLICRHNSAWSGNVRAELMPPVKGTERKNLFKYLGAIKQPCNRQTCWSVEVRQNIFTRGYHFSSRGIPRDCTVPQ